jgi:uncharacterized protein YdeI (YjbR/CyaY-like superfamily)
MGVADALPELLVVDVDGWREWLSDHHEMGPGVWLVLGKKGSVKPTELRYDEALEEALCFGWIDGQVGRRDEVTYRQRFTPRRQGSRWSARNVAIAERLIDEGRMRRAGHAAVEAARADGRWESAYAGQATMEVPEDLAVAMAEVPRAQEMWEILSNQNRYSIVYRINAVKGAETRVKLIERFIGMLARGETFHPQKRTLE